MDETPAPVVRTCPYCLTRQPVDAETGECADLAACGRRARAAGLYAQAEDELDIAEREIRQGAL